MKDYLLYITLALLTILPNSLILLSLFDKIFKDNKTKNLKTICLGANKTLIKNFFRLKTIIIDNQTISIQSNQNNYEIIEKNDGKETKSEINLKDNELIRILASINCFSSNKKTEKIEEAVSSFFNKNNLSKSLLEREYRQIDKVLEDQNKKISTSIVKKIETDEIFAFSKGNPYKILELCSRIIKNGKKEPITATMRHKLKKQIKKLNKNGKKVIAFAIRPLPLKKLDTYTSDFTEKELIFIGLIGVKRPLNRENEKYINEARELGIKTVLITQLKEKTASSVATELNLINKHHFECITGEYFQTLSPQKKEKIILEKDKDYIFCESSGKTKNEIISTLKKHKEKPIWIDKNNTLEKTLKNYKSNKTIQENIKTISTYSIIYKIPLILVFLSANFLKIPPPYTVFTIIYIDILITLPIVLYYREKPLQNSHINLSKIIFGQIISHGILLGLLLFYLYDSHGYDLFSQISNSEIVLKKTSGLLIIWFAFTQFLNILFTLEKEKFEKISLLWLVIIILTLLPIFIFPEIKTLFNTSGLNILEAIIIFSCLGIYGTGNYILSKIK